MLENVVSVDKLRSVFRSKARDFLVKSIHPKLLGEHEADGWTVDRKNKNSVRVKKPKPIGDLLEDRVWTLFYRMGFACLSENRGAVLVLNPKDPKSPRNQIDVVAVDDEVALAVECKSASNPSKRPQFQEELAKHAQVREKFALGVRSLLPSQTKRQVALAFFLENVILSDNDVARAQDQHVALFDETDLSYYENLVNHIGAAARYQFLADLLPGKSISGLEIRIPAVKSKMGGYQCYTFSISPEYLLKISYVSHRAKGKASDVTTYQRMLRKSRLRKIRDYITDDGIFPTNVVVNMEKNRLQFDRIHQESDADPDAGVLGWLVIRPAYRSAWIIDGQHRLFAYSGHPKALKSRLAVLAFEGLSPSKQAELFVDINAKQKSVKRSLLEELYSELNRDSESPIDRASAIVSRAILDLDADMESPFHKRIQKSDDTKDPIRCISLTGIFSALDKGKFLIAREKQHQVVEYGPLWAVTNEKTLRRTTFALKKWFSVIRDSVLDWWDKGSGEGGGLAMNDGVTACINVFRSICSHVDAGKRRLFDLDDSDLFDCTFEFVKAVGEYLASFDEDGRRRFRDLRGVQGQIKRTRMCQKALRDRFPSFSPPGLDEYLEAEKAQTNLKSKTVIDHVEKMLQSATISELRQEYPDGENWWVLGVPKPIRKKAMEKYEEDDGKRGSKECYLDLIDYKSIALHNWPIFEKLFAYGSKGNKEKKLAWLDFVNDRRKVVAHASSGVTLSVSDLGQLQEYDTWLVGQLAGAHNETIGSSATESE
jgi:DNA sulfur modification protein DndB